MLGKKWNWSFLFLRRILFAIGSAVNAGHLITRKLPVKMVVICLQFHQPKNLMRALRVDQRILLDVLFGRRIIPVLRRHLIPVLRLQLLHQASDGRAFNSRLHRRIKSLWISGFINKNTKPTINQSSAHNLVKWNTANQSINQSIGQSINQSTSHSINQSIDQPINQSIDQPLNQSINRPVVQLNQSIDQAISYFGI